MSLAKTVDTTTGAVSRAVSSRRSLFGGAAAVVLGGGVTAGAAASVADYVPADVSPDAALLALRAELMAAVAGIAYDENAPDWDDEEITRSGERLSVACWAIVDSPRAQTPARLALKAAASMYQLRESYNHGTWHGDGEDMAWQLLSALAGSAYIPPMLPARLIASCEPARV